MGGMHAQVYGQISGVDLVAAVDSRVDAIAEKLMSMGVDVPVFASLEKALQEVSCEFVDICLPTHRHCDAALQAIESGKALFCEKPLALSLADADKIIAAADRHGTVAQVGHCIRFWPEYQVLADYHRSGKGGKLLSMHFVRRCGRPGYGVGNWLNKAEQSGGAALDLHIHDTDFVLSLLGLPGGSTSRMTEDDSGPSHIFSLLDYDDAVVYVEGGWNYPEKWGFQMAFQAVYENSVVDYDSSNGKGLTICESGGEPTAVPAGGTESKESKSASSEGNISDLAGYYNQLLYFTDCLKAGESPAIATLEQARASLAFTLAEIANAQTRTVS